MTDSYTLTPASPTITTPSIQLLYNSINIIDASYTLKSTDGTILGTSSQNFNSNYITKYTTTTSNTSNANGWVVDTSGFVHYFDGIPWATYNSSGTLLRTGSLGSGFTGDNGCNDVTCGPNSNTYYGIGKGTNYVFAVFTFNLLSRTNTKTLTTTSFTDGLVYITYDNTNNCLYVLNTRTGNFCRIYKITLPSITVTQLYDLPSPYSNYQFNSITVGGDGFLYLAQNSSSVYKFAINLSSYGIAFTESSPLQYFLYNSSYNLYIYIDIYSNIKIFNASGRLYSTIPISSLALSSCTSFKLNPYLNQCYVYGISNNTYYVRAVNFNKFLQFSFSGSSIANTGTVQIYNNTTQLGNNIIVIPYSPGTAPSSLSLSNISNSETSLSISFTGSSGGSPGLTKYQYSIDNGVTFSDVSNNVTNSPITIYQLTPNTSYSVILRAVSGTAWTSPSSLASNSISTYQIGTAPSSLSLSNIYNSDTSLRLSFTSPTITGTPSLTKYQYSFNGGGFLDAASTTSPITFSALTRNTSYSIVLRSVSVISGTTAWTSSNSSASNPINTNYIGTTPSLTIDSSLNALVLNIGTSNNASPSPTYYYSQNGTITEFSSYTAKYTISGLNTSQNIYVGARGIDTTNGNTLLWDVSSSTISKSPYTIGTSPSLTSISPSLNALILNFGQESTGGNPPPTYYYYNITDNSFVLIGTTYVSTYTISGISGGDKSIYVGAIGYDPSNNIIWDASSDITTVSSYKSGSIPSLSLTSGINSLTLNIGTSNNGIPDVSEYYFYIDGSYVLIGPYVSTYTVSGLTTNASKSVYVGARGYDPSNPNTILWDVSSLIQTATPYVTGTTPSITTITPSLNKLTVVFTDSSGAYPTPTYSYSYYADGSEPIGPVTSPFDISNITTEQTIYIVATNDAGSVISTEATETPYSAGTAPILNSVTPGINSLTVDYTPSYEGTPGANYYYYNIDGSFVSIVNPYQMIPSPYYSPIVISGLTTNVSRSIYVGARDSENNAIWDVSSDVLSNTPYIVGSTPSLTVDSSINALVLNIGESTNGNPSTLTYYYYIDGSFVSIGSYVAKYTITDLTTNASRSIYAGARGIDTSNNNEIIWEVSSVVRTATPYVLGTTPSINSITPGTNKLTVVFTDSSGAYPTPTYYYSYNIDGSSPEGPVTSPFDISTTTAKTVYIIASNTAGNLVSSGVTETPYIFGSNPIFNRITSGINQLTIDFSQNTLGTLPTTYYYSFDGTTKDASCTSPFTISNLTSTSTYSVYIIANNLAGDIVSDASNGYVFGTVPTIDSVVPAINKLTVAFSQSQVGTSPTTYYYSADGSTRIRQVTSPFDINDITTTQTIYVIASNPAGNLTSSSVTATPYVIGSFPTFSIAPAIDSLQLTYSQSTGGVPDASNYYYNLNGTTTIIGAFSSPYTITGLNTNESSDIYMGTRGYDVSNSLIWDASSSTQSATPYIKGSIPTCKVDPSLNSLVLNIGESTGGNPAVSKYYFYIDSSFVSIDSYVAKYTIAGLTTNASRNIYAGARGYDPSNSTIIIWDVSSTIQTVAPYIKGSIPTFSIDSSINSLVLNIGESTGGNPTATYYYSIDGSFVSIGSYVAKYTIAGLTTDVSRNIYVGTRGYDMSNILIWDASSSVRIARPYIVGTFPSISNITPGTNKLTVTFTDSSGGYPTPTHYYSYSADGSNPVGPVTSPFDISGITDTKTVYIVATNSIWTVVSEVGVSETPYIFGSTPTLTLTPGLEKVTVEFSQSQIGTSPTTYSYSYSADGSNSVGPVTSPFDISGITTEKTVYIIASNPAGNLISLGVTGTPYIIGSTPVINAVLSGNNSLIVDFSGSIGGVPSPTYYYSLDNGPYVNGNTDVSPMTIGNLTTIKLYKVTIMAQSVAGNTEASNTVSGVPQIVSYGTKVTPATYWRSNYWNNSSYWKKT